MKAAGTIALVLILAAAAAVEAGSAAGVRPDPAALAKQELLHGRSLLKQKKIELGDKPGPSDSDSECGEWQAGTATSYSTDGTDHGDKPMAPNDLGEYVVPGKFFKARNVVAIDGGEWESDKYHYVEVFMDGTLGRLEVWDVCRDKDCASDNEKCCTTNKETYSDPGYLLDIETHATSSIWGLERAQDWLVAPAWYRVCGSFDFQADVEEFDMECTGLEGDGKCSDSVGTGEYGSGASDSSGQDDNADSTSDSTSDASSEESNSDGQDGQDSQESTDEDNTTDDSSDSNGEEES
ncbi:hypothetical protein ABPG75_010452 [Micractinium tetrahymenae]